LADFDGERAGEENICDPFIPSLFRDRRNGVLHHFNAYPFLDLLLGER
jgi:hypothetical protein